MRKLWLVVLFFSLLPAAAQAPSASTRPPRSKPPKPVAQVPPEDTLEEVEDAPTPGTTRFYLVIRGYETVLSSEPPSASVSSGLRKTDFRRILDGDMQGTQYKFGLFMMQSKDPQNSSASPNDPPGEVLAEIILERGRTETVLASTRFITGPKEKRYRALLTGPDPDTVPGDTLIVRTTWVTGASSVYAMGPPEHSFVDVPQTPVVENDVDRANKAWIITGLVVDRRGRPKPGVRVLISPVNSSGKAINVFGPPMAGGVMFMDNPRPATNAAGRFKLREGIGFFAKGGASPPQGEAVVVEGKQPGQLRPISEPVRFSLTEQNRTIDVGKLIVNR